MTRATTRLRQAMVPGPSFNLADLLEIVADTLADRPALIAGERRLTFAELDERANRLGHVLLGIGARRGDHVGILSWNCAEWVESFFGCLKAGVVPINLNYRYTAKELRVVLEDCEAVAVVVHPGLDDLLAKADACREKKRLVLRIGDELEALADEASSRRDFEARSGDDRYILYTGG
ncbi:MAG: AMP-binding protein, partial [Acidimicrobiales bacterium]